MSVAPARLAVAPECRLPDSVTDADHELVVIQAHEWQQTAGSANFWESGTRTEEGRVYELAGQMASTGERLALAYAGAIEVALWQDFRGRSEPDPEHEMRMRGMAEAQCLFVMGTGNALANVAVRALALDPSLRAGLIKKFGGKSSSPTFDPFSQARVDWPSLGRGTCKTIRAVAESSEKQRVIQMVEPVVGLGTGSTWKELEERRGEDFHRWRPQTHGIEGVPRSSPWTRLGNARSIAIGHPVYEEARGLADETARLASRGMIDLARSMKVFMDRWPAASNDLGGPKFKLA